MEACNNLLCLIQQCCLLHFEFTPLITLTLPINRKENCPKCKNILNLSTCSDPTTTEKHNDVSLDGMRSNTWHSVITQRSNFEYVNLQTRHDGSGSDVLPDLPGSQKYFSLTLFRFKFNSVSPGEFPLSRSWLQVESKLSENIRIHRNNAQ